MDTRNSHPRSSSPPSAEKKPAIRFTAAVVTDAQEEVQTPMPHLLGGIPPETDSNLGSNLGSLAMAMSYPGSDGNGSEALSPTPHSDRLRKLAKEIETLRRQMAGITANKKDSDAIERAEEAAAMAEANTAAAIQKAEQAADIAEALAQQQSDQLQKIYELLPMVVDALAQIEGEVALVKHLANSVAAEAAETKITRAALEVTYATTESKATDAAEATATHLASVKKIKGECEELNTTLQMQVEELKLQIATIRNAVERAEDCATRTIEAARIAQQHADAEARHAATTQATETLVKRAQDKFDEAEAARADTERFKAAADQEALQKIQALIQKFKQICQNATKQLQAAEQTIDRQHQVEQALQAVYETQTVFRRRQVRDAVKSVIQDFALALLCGAGLALVICFPPTSAVLAILLLAITGVGAVIELGFTLSAARRWWQVAHDKTSPFPDFSPKPWQSTSATLLPELGMEAETEEDRLLMPELVPAHQDPSKESTTPHLPNNISTVVEASSSPPSSFVMSTRL